MNPQARSYKRRITRFNVAMWQCRYLACYHNNQGPPLLEPCLPTPTPTDDATKRAEPVAQIAPSRPLPDVLPCMVSANPA